MTTLEPFSLERAYLFYAKTRAVPAPPGLGLSRPCLIWIACIDDKGYGNFTCPGFPSIKGPPKAARAPVKAHRWAAGFQLGVDVLHLLQWDHSTCRRHSCVEVSHGIPATNTENNVRRNAMLKVPICPIGDPFEVLGI